MTALARSGMCWPTKSAWEPTQVTIRQSEISTLITMAPNFSQQVLISKYIYGILKQAKSSEHSQMERPHSVLSFIQQSKTCSWQDLTIRRLFSSIQIRKRLFNNTKSIWVLSTRSLLRTMESDLFPPPTIRRFTSGNSAYQWLQNI